MKIPQMALHTGLKAGELTVYGTSSCPWCKKQKENLDSKKIPYTFVDCSREKCPEFVTGYPTSAIQGFHEF
jgi:hypothetical protein